MNFLIHGGAVLTLGPKTQNYHAADVLVEDGIITEVGLGVRARGAVEIDASHSIVMPGFVDGHRRCRRALHKNMGAWHAADPERVPSPADVYAGTLLALYGAAEAGITTVVDWYDGPASDEHLDSAVQAHRDASLRTVLVLATGDDPATVWRSAVGRYQLESQGATTLAAGLPSIAGTDADRLGVLMNAARTSGLRIHAKAGPADSGVIAALASRGLLGPDVTFAHCTGLSDGDLDALASSNVGVVVTPTSDMTNGPGTPPMQALLDRGIEPGLGIDDDYQGAADVLAQMRAAISVQHARYFDLKLAGKGGLPNLLSTRNVIKYGTIAGTAAVGLADRAGSIEVGKQADLVVMRIDRPNIHPINDPIGAVVWGVDTSNVDQVFVGGDPVVQDGLLQGDVDRVRELVGASIGASAPQVGPATVRDV